MDPELARTFGVIGAGLIGGASFAVLFRTPRRYLPHTITLGLLACCGINLRPTGLSLILVTFLVAVSIGSISHVLARRTGTPAQAFIIPGVIFLVPGTLVYRAFHLLASRSFNEAAELLLVAVAIAVAVSFGLLLANLIFPPRTTL